MDRELEAVGGHGAPPRVQRIAVDPRGHDERRAAPRRRTSDGAQQRQGCRVGPMDVLDRDQQRLVPRARLYELRDHPFLAARTRRRVERLIEGSIALALRNLEQVAQVRRIVVRLSIPGCGDDRPVDVPQ